MRVLVTGGAGYIGSHTCVALLEAGHDVVVVDSLANGSLAALDAVRAVTGREIAFHRLDLREPEGLRRVFAAAPIHAVLHFAAAKAVAESVRAPLDYFDNNVGGLVALCRAMLEAGVKRMVFSSSATVYGVPARVPVAEDEPLAAVNPYGRTKLFNEAILEDLQRAEPDLRVALLRYFNPGGAHPSGRLGESPRDLPNNLLPFVSQVAVGRLACLRVFGGDYDTPDGTGVRDYIHVVDLAAGHLAALDALDDPAGPWRRGAVLPVNLGTGRGYSVLEVVRAFERACGRQIPFEIAPRRVGDVAACYADPSRAADWLGWRAELGIDRICSDAWRWQQGYPDGFPADEVAPATGKPATAG